MAVWTAPSLPGTIHRIVFPARAVPDGAGAAGAALADFERVVRGERSSIPIAAKLMLARLTRLGTG